MTIDSLFAGLFGTEVPEPGLGRLQQWWEEFQPPLPPTNIAIAGTNGKGTVAYLLEQAVQRSGLRTMLFTSPHIQTIRERIRVNAAAMPESWWYRHSNDLAAWCRKSGTPLTYFEAVFCLAVQASENPGLDVCIWEAGLGGRLDAINIIPRFDMLLLSHIGIDHTEYLGDTVADILREKLGLLRPRTPVVVGDVPEELMPRVIGAVERRKGYCIQAHAQLPGGWEAFATAVANVPGIHPTSARVFAWAMVLMDIALPEDLAPNTLSAAPGRMSRLEPGIVCDVGHNSTAVKYLVSESQRQNQKLAFNLQERKDLAAVCNAIAEQGCKECIVLDMGTDTGFYPVEKVQEKLEEAGIAVLIASPEDILLAARTQGESFLVFGSFFIVQYFQEMVLA